METLDKHFRELTRAAFLRHGFAQADLAAHWPEIAGAELARVSAPERLKWPRTAADTARKAGATLVLRAAPGRGLELEYEVPRIIERLNRFLGYGAVTAVKVVQAATWPRPAPQPARSAAEPVCGDRIARIDTPELRAALERLGSAVAAGPSRFSTS